MAYDSRQKFGDWIFDPWRVYEKLLSLQVGKTETGIWRMEVDLSHSVRG